ncbi:MAG: hypothetical protein N4A33_10635 [Bacteriovoracaceae bacterium]|jgi:hypothetical protein|nr:hypothetical protein [Bacteriovoracaceae bacterium]
MKNILFLISSLIFISCSSTPKGEYSRSFIERPYALPDDIASAKLGVRVQDLSSSDITSTAISTFNEDEEQTVVSMPIIGFEHGISDSVNWIYPLGLRWNIYNNEKHTFGASLASLILYTTYSFDYWYRINDKLSLRPYFLSEQIHAIFFEDRRDFFGLNFVYQASKKVALKLNYAKGEYEGSSKFFDAIIDSITGNNESDISITGDISRIGVSTVYSFSNSFDLNLGLMHSTLKADDFSVKTIRSDLSITYFY